MAGGHRGLNVHLSEIVSDILEPIVGVLKGGREVISTEDLLANCEDLNNKMVGWKKTTWWEGKTLDNYEACGDCMGSMDYIYDGKSPELCNCGRVGKEGFTRTTAAFMKTHRRLRWESDND